METQNILYSRTIESRLRELLFKGKIIVLYGARQVGKTTLVKKLIEEFNGVYLLCEEPDIADAFTRQTSAHMKAFIGDKKFVVFDEAQKISNIGTSLKLLIDSVPDLQIIATGSSSFEIANKINEPLTGRNYELLMSPLSVSELATNDTSLEIRRSLDRYLIYGMYPGVINAGTLRQENIQKIGNDYLYKDILIYEGIRKPELLQKILRALAFQVGAQVSYSEIATMVGASRNTVQSYVDILEKAFIIFKLPPLHRNKRDEVKTQHKIYFYDNGILNTLLNNFNPPTLRDDMGRVFENFFVSEKMKQKNNTANKKNFYFWRAQKGGEVDFIEEDVLGSGYRAFECKYGKTKAKVPSLFASLYKPAQYTIVTRDTVIEVLQSTYYS